MFCRLLPDANEKTLHMDTKDGPDPDANKLYHYRLFAIDHVFDNNDG